MPRPALIEFADPTVADAIRKNTENTGVTASAATDIAKLVDTATAATEAAAAEASRVGMAASVKAVADVASDKESALVAASAAAERAKTAVEASILRAGSNVVADIAAANRKNTINLLWEGTQAFLAIALTTATITAAFMTSRDIPSTLTNALFVVLGFYFGRTNHARPTPTMPGGGNDVLSQPVPGKRE